MAKDSRPLSKTNPRYWESKVFHTRSRGRELAGFSVRLQHDGQRHALVLNATTKEAAGKEARDLYLRLKANGWINVLEDYQTPSGNKKLVTTTSEDPLPRDFIERPTIGDLIRFSHDYLNVRPSTFESYAKSIRTVASQIYGIHPHKKYARGKHAQRWRNRVDKIPLEKIRPCDVLRWKNRRLREHNGDAVRKRRTIITVNSLMRGAKALYGRKVFPFLKEKMNLPDPMPFDGVPMEREPSLRYQSHINAKDLLIAARDSLAEKHPEQFKIFLLALICGLRKGEIDCLRWDAFDFDRQVLHIEHTTDHELKSEDSAGEIDLDEATNQFFRQQKETTKGRFVIQGRSEKPAGDRKTRSYRCDWHFNELYVWLRKQGLESNHPLHELRKEVGSLIANEQGIFEASRYLRHSDIRITSRFYTDKKKVITPGLGAILSTSASSDGSETRSPGPHVGEERRTA